MSFKDYDSLQAEIRSFLWDRPDVADKIPSFITLAESEIRRELRTRQSTFRRNFSVGGSTISVPCGSSQIASVHVNTGGLYGDSLEYVAPERFSSIPIDDVGIPQFYTVMNDRIHFQPRGEAEGEIVFVGPFDSLSEQCKTNWLLERHPDIYLCGALKWGKAWLIDSDQDWASPFYAAIAAANRDNPRVQMNTKLRADEATFMGSRNRFDIRTGGIL